MALWAVLFVASLLLNGGICQSVIFSALTYSASFSEEQPIGSSVVRLDVTGFDSSGNSVSGDITLSGADAQYFSLGNSAQQLGGNFLIDINSAIVFDWDQANAQRMFSFFATFTVPGSISSSVTVIVLITDVNDNTPQFPRDQFVVQIPELQQAGVQILDVSAVDPDQILFDEQEIVVDPINNVVETVLVATVTNGLVTYSITSGNELGHFSVTSDTGILSVAPGANLDVDQIFSYNLTILAVDGGGRNSSAEVFITILDSNDNAPVIVSPRGVEVSISEDTEVGYVIVDSINATDADSGVNAEFRFLIVDGDSTGSFGIDEATGRINVSRPLDRETQAIYNLTVAARDGGMPALQDTTFVVVRLLDVNDFSPRFPQNSYTISISENSGLDRTVARIVAEDLDEGVNGTVSYSLIGGFGRFYVNSVTGDILTNASLDREERSSYSLTLEAVDSPQNSSYQLSSQVNVTVLVEDINDNPPIFERSSYTIEVLDNITRIVPIIQLQAFDADSGTNQQVVYEILTPDPRYPIAFRIDPNTGEVFRNRRLSYQNQSEFLYVIEARDNTQRPRFSDPVTLTIILHDVNINSPVFNPVFYNNTIREDTSIGTSVVTVSATDVDDGPIGEVRYRIVTQFDDAGSFMVNETSGKVLVASRLDFDFRSTIHFTVEAYDGGFPQPFTDYANVTVTLTGQNDEAPIIVFPDGFQLEVPENVPPEVDIAVLRDYTIDPDIGQTGEFSFQLSAIYDELSENASFSLNETTGLLTSLRTFDREEQPGGINVTVTTVDFEGLTRDINLTVAIRDMNDNSPFFTSTAEVTVYEFLPAGTEVLRNFEATDEDIGSNADLRYFLASASDRELFTMESSSGTLFTAAILNKTVQDTYNITVLVMDQGIIPLFGYGTIIVTVLDSNDMIPVFSMLLYEAFLPENMPPGSFVAAVNATDDDIGTNSEIRYYISYDNYTSGRFILDELSGVINTTDMFDREVESTINLTVVAVDSGLVPHPLTGSATVRVSIKDVNDHTPEFVASVYNATVIENMEINSTIAMARARDEDATPPNNVISYSLRGARSDTLGINPVTGEIYVAGEVDWEEGMEFTIFIEATDRNGQNYSLSASVPFVVTIIDVNDNSPIFLPSSLNLTIEENLSPVNGSISVGFVLANDSDSSGNNSDVTYSVVMDFANGKFTLDPLSGEVFFVRGNLNRERRQFYELEIRATDQGMPRLHTDATLIISVADANDFDPVFVQDMFSGSVAERAAIGTSVLAVNATDGDEGSNAELRYKFDGFLGSEFAIDSTTGIVSVADVLDFEDEARRLFNIPVIVCDLGHPSRSASALVTIAVTDSNDLYPIFTQLQYSAVIRENLASGTVVERVIAFDNDTDRENMAIFYSLAESPGSQNFGVDNASGVVYTVTSLDREQFSEYNLTIVASNSLSQYPLSTPVQLMVNVTDLNDMHPTLPLAIDVAVFENETIGSLVYTLNAIDGDEAGNGTIEYSLVRPSDYFSLNRSTGAIILTRNVDREGSERIFILPVRMNDLGSPSLINFTNVIIRVMDSNDNPPEFAASEYSISVSSRLTIGDTFLRLIVQDKDDGRNAEVTTTIASGNDQGLFGISDSGELSLQASLMAFAGMTFPLTIRASDGLFSSSVNVTIQVLGTSNNLPGFSRTGFSAVLSEQAQINTPVFDFSPDVFNVDTFSVNSNFLLVDNSGNLVLSNSTYLDFETQPVHQVTVTITQSATQETAHEVLTLSITDENEHPPLFVTGLFSIWLPETAPVGDVVFTAIVTDQDGSDANTFIQYDLDLTPNAAARSKFSIAVETGEIRLAGSLIGDESFNLTIRATNTRASQPLFSTSTLAINVLDGNSFSPVFAQRIQTLFYPEDVSQGLNILNLSATDMDSGSSGSITYGLHGDHHYLDFRIDTFTGALYISEPLDYERSSSYTLNVVASDGGNPIRSSTTIVFVEIMDLNDNSPIWLQDVYSVTLLESTEIGTSVIQVMATDRDSIGRSTDINGNVIITGRNGYIEYSISQGDPGNYFSVDPDTGIVMVASSLDREAYGSLNLTLNATDGGGLFANAYLQVTIIDVNDVVPRFLQNPYQVGLSEDAQEGTLVATIAAEDSDLRRNSEVRYLFFDDPTVSLDDPTFTFSINDTTGKITLEQMVDRELIQQYTLTVIAVDMGTPPLTGTTQVIVSLLDINEFPPVFTESSFSGEVFENSPPTTSVLQVNATDVDFGENGTVLYSIISGDAGVFSINSETGMIFIIGPIDYEVVNRYELIVMATDAAVERSVRLTSTANITITVLDENDNQPNFIGLPYIALISEHSLPGDYVLNASAIDFDSGSNSDLVYSLSFPYQGSSNNFQVNSITGAITLSDSADLDREVTPSYNFTVTVTDRGSPPLQSSATVVLNLADENDNTPQFTLPYFEGRILENQQPFVLVANVSAEDADAGSNAELFYSIISIVPGNGSCFSGGQVNEMECAMLLNSSSSLPSSFFQIDPFSGTISTARLLDRENIGSFLIGVTVFDGGNPFPLTNFTFVLIEVIDDNDETPTFSQVVYYANISEHAQSGVMVTQVEATDLDSGSNAEITFILSGSNKFTIISISGEIFTLADNFDREREDIYNLTITATDNGMPSLSSSAVVVVTLLDENDSPPIFLEPAFSGSVQENGPIRAFVLQVNASDADIGSNAELTFSINSSNPASHFEIDGSSGQLYTTQPLDRERISSYSLVVTVVDGGFPSLSAATQVEVTVTDENDFAPAFIGIPYTVTQEENVVPSQPILRVVTFDQDIGSNQDVFYSITDIQPFINGTFEIGSSNGELSLLRQLDAEESLYYNITIVADNGGAMPQQSSETVAVISVVDVNDNSPIFGQQDYAVPFLESSPIGSTVVEVTASDDDATLQNSQLDFEITGGYNRSLFNITSSRPGVGVVSVAMELDRELEPAHRLEITVFDNGTPRRSAMTTLSILVQDANDNTPIFEQTSYSFSLTENSPLSTLVGAVRANDLDIQNITYSLLETTRFRVDPVTGQIYTADIFNREVQVVHSIVAVATDFGNSDLRRNASVNVSITVLDLNDNAPEFTNSTFFVQTFENASISSLITTVTAFDLDFGDNGAFEYSILARNDSSFFSINSTSGAVFLDMQLDRETQDIMEFYVSATDKGIPARTSTALVTVTVLDNNDNVPVLDLPAYTSILPENSMMGTFVALVRASDRDIDENADIRFSLGGDFSRTFEIGETSGVISLVGSLDYERTVNYSFFVVARDSGVESLFSSSPVFVEVVDLNDNSPEFDSNIYEVSVPENAVLGTTIFQIPATDADSTTNGELRYSILSGNLRSAFSVNEDTGFILIADDLDREITDSYILTVTATDQGIAQFTATADILVSIMDVNDHRPSFTSNTYFTSVSESVQRGTNIIRLLATDLDSGSNANLTFSIVAGNRDRNFVIDSMTGELSTAGPLDVVMTPSYALTVQVSDGGSPEPLTDTAVVRVNVLDANTHPPALALSEYFLNISQSLPVGTPIGHFMATDEDNGVLTYNLIDSPDYFVVNSLDGSVYVNRPLDIGQFNFTLTVTDGELSTSIGIIVTVVADTLAPQLFGASTYLFEISEAAGIGAVVGRVLPIGSFVTNATDLFQISSDGNIVVSRLLDSETVPHQVLNVVHQNAAGDPPVFTVVTIKVTDINDYSPQFESEVYLISLSEAIPPGTSLSTLSAFDLDLTRNNSAITLYLSRIGNNDRVFILDELTGVLSTNGTLDYEQVSEYNLTATAVNFLGSPMLSSTVQVLISLTDINDNSPQFSQPFYQVSVPESTSLGSEIIQLEASDPDSGSNSELVYSITHIDLPQAFAINQSTGSISVNTRLDLEDITSYTIFVRVADRGNPQPLAVSTLVFVEVTPDNLGPPLFSQPTGYQVTIPETLGVGDIVLQVTATEAEMSSGIMYSFTSQNVSSHFVIDSLTGEISLLSSLDFNVRSFYTLVVQATDSGTPPLYTSVGVNVTVQDINNHVPLFNQRNYRTSLLENATIGTSVLTVGATDEDSAGLSFVITTNYRNTLGEAAFAINATSGEISTTASLDRETDDMIEILVTALDSGYPIIRSNSIPVVVDVLDVNDNAPVFPSTPVMSSLLRLLSQGMQVLQVQASDADLVGNNLTYEVVSDDSGGLFAIDSSSGVIVTTRRVDESIGRHNLVISAFDGIFSTSLPIVLVPEDNGNFCEDNGYCTSVREVDCIVDFVRGIPCIPYCGDQNYALSPRQQVCLRYYCMNSSLVPCVATESCLPPNMGCNGACPQGQSLCPTTDICHSSTLTGSCDSSGITCLVGRSLVQGRNQTRSCIETNSLPLQGRNCSNTSVYCEELGVCMSLSAPDLCQACPGMLVQCPGTGECVTELIRCCQSNEFFCEVLSTCIDSTLRCELPNIPPENLQELIYLGSISDYVTTSSSPVTEYVISEVLGNETDPAVDLQGEELSIAITGASSLAQEAGEWQVSIDSDDSWTTIASSELSDSNSLLLPSTASLRFVRRSVDLDGAVWLRVKLWDGNVDGYISPNLTLVRSKDFSFASTTPYTSTSAFSQESSLMVILLLPLNTPPSFLSSSSQWNFSSIQEDMFVGSNLGNVLSDVLSSVHIPDFRVLPTTYIEGFPTSSNYEEQLPTEVRNMYFSVVANVNPTRIQRQMSASLSQTPGVGVALDPSMGNSGVWQIALRNNPQLFVNLESVLTDNTSVLLDTNTRLRFLPRPDFCGIASILIAPWDGYWTDSIASISQNGFLLTNIPPSTDVSSSSRLSVYNLGQWERGVVNVLCVSDTPSVLNKNIMTSTIPYRLVHVYSSLFTIAIDREPESVRRQADMLAIFLQIVVRSQVSIRRISSAPGNRTTVSFTVEDSSIDFETVNMRISLSTDILSMLNFNILNVSQAASYGPEGECQGPLASEYHGDTANMLAAAIGRDVEESSLGLAVTGLTNTARGMWQYQRSTWAQNNSYSSAPWVNLPSEVSSSSAFLLRGNDRIRFLPYPEFFWNNRSNEVPHVRVKLWDMSSSMHILPLTEVLAVNVNTNPQVDTLQSLYRPIGLFSSDEVTITAARLGCDGIVNSGLVHDACCVCGGTGMSCAGCDGTEGSNVVYDSCHVCGGTSSCLGCDLIPFSGTVPGQCSECTSVVNSHRMPNVTLLDCNGECYGTALLDDCGVCSGGNTTHVFNSNKDCAGICFGTTVTDTCGDCTGPGTNLTFDQNLDCSGVCGGLYREDSCGVCQLPGPNGIVREFRDCSGTCFGSALLDSCGVCYGGSTGIREGSALDSCGVCNGNNSSCIGCDGKINSGVVIDRCGHCGGNNCGCFLLHNLVPNIGPMSGGTSVLVQGAGLFLNDSSLLNFQFDSNIPNCGAPMRFLDNSIIPVRCSFQSPSQRLSSQATPIDQASVNCRAPVSTISGTFTLAVSVNNGPFSAPLEFTYYDQNSVSITSFSPVEWPLNSSPQVTFTGAGFINSSAAACLIYNIHECTTPAGQPPAQGYVTVAAQFASTTEMSCILPWASVPCRISVYLSLDGQVSGIVGSSASMTFTYRFGSPNIVRSIFLDDLSGVLFEFDRQVVPSDLSCVEIFNEETFERVGGFGATCSWLNSIQNSLVLSLPSNGSIQVGSSITFRDGALQTRDQLYSFSNRNVTVFVGGFPINPVAVIDSTDSIPFCGSFSLTGTYSQYPGYSGFQYFWSILIEDTTVDMFSELQQHLSGLDPRLAASITLNSSSFLPSQAYYFNLYVINSLGLESQVESVRLIKDPLPKPGLFIVGTSNLSLQSGENLQLESVISTPECLVLSAVQFQWELTRIVDQRRNITVAEDIMTVRRGSHQIFIPSRYLTENSNYEVRVSASFVEDPSQISTATVNLTILPDTLLVRIHGGSRMVSTQRQLILDARNSSFSPSLTPPTFSWRCSVANSTNACFNTSVQSLIPTPISLPRSHLVSFPASILSTNTSYMFTLKMEQGGREAERSVVITVVDDLVPIVEVGSTFRNVLVSEELSLFGYVYSSGNLESVQWNSVAGEGRGFVDLQSPEVVQTLNDASQSSLLLSSPVVTTQPDVINRVNLIISPNTLNPDLRYTFRLTATNSLGSSYAEVMVQANPPPKSAVLSSVPSSGVSLQTEFELTVTGALDSPLETPLLYQFGVVLNDSLPGTSYSNQYNDPFIQWLGPPQVLPTIRTILHSGEATNNYTVPVIARVFDRNGGHSDVFADVTSYEVMNVTTELFNEGISRIEKSLNSSKDWSDTLTRLSIYSIEINKHSSEVDVSMLKEEAFRVFLDVFDNYLPISSNHFPVATSILSSLIVNFNSSNDNLRRMVSSRLKDISLWYRNETALSNSFDSIPLQNSNEPQELQGSYLSPERELLSLVDATSLLYPWTQFLKESNQNSLLQSDFLEVIESVSDVLCQQASTGERSSFIMLPSVVLHTVISAPMGFFNVSRHAIDFGSSVSDAYESQACETTGLACSETCFAAATFLNNATNNAADTRSMPLESESFDKISAEIEGSDPSKLELASSILSVSLHIPSEQSYLSVRNLNSSIDVFIPVIPNSAENGSVLLCVYQEVGGEFGFQDMKWKLDDTTSPVIVESGSSEYYLCRFNHLTLFAVVSIPPPVITVPPTTPSPTTPTPIPTTEPSTEEPTTIASTDPPSAGSPVGVIVAVIIVLLILGAVIVILVVLFIVWRQKKKKKLKIAPDESHKVEPDPVELIQAGPLTPAESKILMDIIQCIEDGKRSRLGKLNVLPSIRLRELRNEIIENFPALKNKPFYFLTRQLCDIEPTTEQQQFVSIVYGDKPIFIREVVSESMLTKKHFCVCGNAALLECSNCLSQGYCSQECQNKHWVEKHQKECGRLSERKRRADVLYNRQSTAVSPVQGALAPINEVATPKASVGAVSLSKSAATSDWKSIMQQRRVSAIDAQKTSQFPAPVRSRTLSVPSGNVTTLGSLSRQMSLTQPDQPRVAAQAQPVASTPSGTATLRPLKKLPISGDYESHQSGSDRPSVSRMTSVVGSLAPLSPQRSVSLSQPPGQSISSAPLAAPQVQPLFTRQPLPTESSRPPPPVRHLSIQSLGSPMALSPGIRNEPLLEAPEDEDMRRSRDGSNSRRSSDSRPPTLAVRKKGSRRQSVSSDESSSTEDYDSSEDSDDSNSDDNKT